MVVSLDLHHGQGIADVLNSTFFIDPPHPHEVPSGTAMPWDAKDARPSLVMRSIFHGGSLMKITSTEPTPCMSPTFCLMLSAIAGSAMQPTNVGSNEMFTTDSSSSMFSMRPRSKILMGISGSGIVLSTSMMSFLFTMLLRGLENRLPVIQQGLV